MIFCRATATKRTLVCIWRCQKQQHWDVISIFTIWQETSGKKQTSSSGKKHLTRNISKESGHCLASQLLIRIEWSQLAHINSAACCLVGGPAVSQCRAAACSSDGHHPCLEKLWLMLALPRGPQAAISR